MPMVYPLKRVLRNWKLFTALLIGIALAATFFACIDVKANSTAEKSLNQQLKNINPDMQFTSNLNYTEVSQAQGNISSIKGVSSVDVVFRFNYPVKDLETNFTDYPQIVCLPDSSSIYNYWTNKPAYIDANQTYVLAGTLLASKVHVGDNITSELMFPTPNQGNWSIVYLNFTVAGFAELTETGYQLLSGNSYITTPFVPPSSEQTYEYPQDLMLIGWNSTLKQFWSGMTNRTVQTTFLINVNYDKNISPWNIPASLNNIDTIQNSIQNKVLSIYQTESYISNNLDYSLQNFNYNFQNTLNQFILFSIPVFFISWYLGLTLSDVSFNMRRREIGLLSTKGLSSRQIQNMFLGEALALGVVGGSLGVVGGLILNQVFNGGLNLNTLFSPQAISPYTMVFTVVFGVILALVSVFWSAHKASKLPTVEALRDYAPAWDFNRWGYRWILPLIAVILGTYEIVIVFFGINPTQSLSGATSGNYFSSIFIAPIDILDQILGFIGPLLFFYGVTKLMIQYSLKFQQALSKVSRVMGDFSALAAKNVRRNPARIAAIAFMIAFIIGYGVQVNGQIASQQNYLVRQVKYDVGADVSIGVVNATKATQVLSEILGNVSGIQTSTLQCQLTQNYAGTVIRTVDPSSWLNTAYSESGWFSGASMKQAFTAMENNNMTIILEQRIAQQLKLKVGDTIAIDFPSGARTLTIVGLFGPKLPTNEIVGASGFSSPLPGGPIIYQGFYPSLITWSYVPRNLFNMSSSFSDAYKDENFDEKILLKLDPGVNGTAVAEKIRSLNLEIEGVTSFAEQWQQTQQGSIQTVTTSNGQNPYFTLQVLDFQNLGIAFALLSASVGMVMIAVVSLSERSREATLMSVRGLSYGQLVWMFLAENLAVITFAVLLGIGVGLVIDYGTINSANVGLTQLVIPHFVYPASSLETVAWYVGLIYASTIGAILIMARRYVTKLERMVRTR